MPKEVDSSKDAFLNNHYVAAFALSLLILQLLSKDNDFFLGGGISFIVIVLSLVPVKSSLADLP